MGLGLLRGGQLGAIPHSAPLVPVVVLHQDGTLVLQQVRAPTEANMHRKAGLKTASGGFGRQPDCPGLWPGWSLYARPPPPPTSGWGSPGDVVGPAVFVALVQSPPPADVDAILEPCTVMTTVLAVTQMRQRMPPPAAEVDDDDDDDDMMVVAPQEEAEEEAEEEAVEEAVEEGALLQKKRTKVPKVPKVAKVVKVPKPKVVKVKAPKAPKAPKVPKAKVPKVPKEKKITRKELEAHGRLAKTACPPKAKTVRKAKVIIAEPAPVMDREEFNILQLEPYDNYY